ncbi:dihydroorotate dehydrogenase-like protein [Isachenkonia alkalipeptolytica]|uniref:Dihydroorotate dehydrogenase-like protein n=1 Tax=Isachenkonia alkalipeptolytica TaxID=2565777 RepID=A0AA43XIJ4_9CLOT|nr:dihydroorotate dehydrogenase-like protein [Isachenkonia alkalipeptolytica]
MEVLILLNLETTYMGIPMKNPIVAGASALSSDMKNLKRLEFSGVGAIVVKSLFEEEIELTRFKFEEEMEKFDHIHAEMTSIYPHIDYKGTQEHLYWLKKVKNKVHVPIIASLNAHNLDTWVEYAQAIEKTGVDGLELNFYELPQNSDITAEAIERKNVEVLKSVKAAVNIPVSVKLSPYYTNMASVVKDLENAGADAVILFNRLFQPEIDINEEEENISFDFSQSSDSLLALRWTALLSPVYKGDIISSKGIIQGEDMIKMLLAGAQGVQVVSTLYKNGLQQIEVLLKDLEEWMKGKGYQRLEDFRGKMAKDHMKDPWAYERSQYIKMLLSKENL